MTNSKELVDLSNLGAALPPTAPGLGEEVQAGLVSALKDKSESLAPYEGSVMKSLTPKIKKRVEFLQGIQTQHDELQTKFYEERAALEAKYQKLYEPLYAKRSEVVNGEVEVEGNTFEDTEGATSDQKYTEEAGIPCFWLTAMNTNPVLVAEISVRDVDALMYLKDIKWCRIDNPRGFKLDFFFDSNPFFKNSILTKTYHIVEDEEPILEKAIGTEIEWFQGKCLTQKILKKKQNKGLKTAKPITKTEKCDSFFNFFNPPQIPEEDEIDIDVADELQNQMERDYDIGSTIRDQIIPRAVSWFTGEAAERETEDEDEFNLEESDDDDEDDDDEDDEEDEDSEDDEEEQWRSS